MILIRFAANRDKLAEKVLVSITGKGGLFQASVQNKKYLFYFEQWQN